MRDALGRLANWMAQRQTHRRSRCTIASSAKVNYRGIRDKPPSRLCIGEGSMFEGRILSEREGSVVVIGTNTFIGGSSLICAERIEVGDDVLISWGCTIVDHHSHGVDWRDRSNDVSDWYQKKKNWDHVRIHPIKICNRAWIGFNAIILAGVTIGENAVVGCGSVVTKDVAPYSVVAGNPARVIRVLENENAS